MVLWYMIDFLSHGIVSNAFEVVQRKITEILG